MKYHATESNLRNTCSVSQELSPFQAAARCHDAQYMCRIAHTYLMSALMLCFVCVTVEVVVLLSNDATL